MYRLIYTIIRLLGIIILRATGAEIIQFRDNPVAKGTGSL
jgi:hypothetical protein